jgi:hypothetical protein
MGTTRHSSESWNPIAFTAAVARRETPAFAGMTAVNGMAVASWI